jgi:hypothetical protein
MEAALLFLKSEIDCCIIDDGVEVYVGIDVPESACDSGVILSYNF